jgi:serine/threonine protein kinase
MEAGKLAERSFGQYELEQLVGQDAFRFIYSAYDSEKNRHMLISVLRERYAADVSSRANYIDRARALSRIRHPNIATICDVGLMPSNLPYVAAEQIEGFTLADRLSKLANQQSPAHVIYALTLVRQIASGLSLAERLGYFHYELTPRHISLKNMTLKADASAVLVNLDVSPEFASEEIAADESYRQSYLSPEQLKNKEIDGRSHVFSLGIILFQLLTGTVPEKNRQFWPPLLRSLSSAGSALQKLRTDLTPETYALIDKSIRTRPGSRYLSLKEFVYGIDQAIAAEELQIHTSDLAEPRRPRPIYLAPLLLLLVCIMLAVTTWWISTGDALPSASILASSVSPMPSATSPASPQSSPSPTNPLNTVEQTATHIAVRSVTKNPVVDLTVFPSRVVSPSQSVVTVSVPNVPSRELQQTATPEVQITATTPPTEMPEIPTQRPEYRISVSSASLRQGPGTQFGVDGYLFESEEAVIIGKNNTPDIWYLVRTSDGRLGWISSTVGEPVEPTTLQNVALAATIPVPPPTFTPSPTATPIPTDTPTSPINRDDGNNNNDEEDERPKPKSTPTPPL